MCFSQTDRCHRAGLLIIAGMIGNMAWNLNAGMHPEECSHISQQLWKVGGGGRLVRHEEISGAILGQ